MVRAERKKNWDEKLDIVKLSYNRAKIHPTFASDFYSHLFFLSPKIKNYFKNTKFEHQHKALMFGLNYLIGYLDEKQNDGPNKVQVLRLARTHSAFGLKIHPRDYYYWIEALIMTLKDADPKWENDLQYYWREVIFFPISFMITQYFIDDH